MKDFSKINKFSQNIIRVTSIFSLFIVISGIFLLDNHTFYRQLYIARKLIETGFSLLPLSVILAFITNYIYKKTVS